MNIKFERGVATYRESMSFALPKNSHFDVFWHVFDIQSSKNIYYSPSNIPEHLRIKVPSIMKEIRAIDSIFIGNHVYGLESDEETVRNEVISPQTCTM